MFIEDNGENFLNIRRYFEVKISDAYRKPYNFDKRKSSPTHIYSKFADMQQ